MRVVMRACVPYAFIITSTFSHSHPPKGIKHDQAFDGALKGLESYGMIVLKKIETKTPTLLPDGQAAIDNGSPEFQVYNAIPAEGGIPKPELDVSIKQRERGKLKKK